MTDKQKVEIAYDLKAKGEMREVVKKYFPMYQAGTIDIQTYNKILQYWGSLHPPQKKEVANEELVETKTLVEKEFPEENLIVDERINKHFKSYMDERVSWVFGKLSDGKEHPKDEIYKAMHEEKGWTYEHDLRKIVSTIRDQLQAIGAKYYIPLNQGNKPAIYQLKPK